MSDLPGGLTFAEVERVHAAAEGLLADTGLRVAHAGLRERCRKAGATVEEAREVVRFPRELFRALLREAPQGYTVRGVDGQTWEIGGEQQHCLAIVTDPWIIDYPTGQPRRPCLDDLRRHTIIANQLPDVFAVSRMDFPVSDVAGPHSSLRALHEHLKFHRKHIMVLAANEASWRQWLEIGAILCHGTPFAGSGLITVGVAVISPLTVSALNAQLLLEACEHGCPIVPTVCPQAGTTAPYSLAGTLLQAHVENLGMLALTQIVRPGHPFLYALGPSVADMRSGHDRYYTLDKVLWKQAGVHLAQACGLPCTAECGGTMTHRTDAQCGAEGMLFMLAAQACGADVLAGIGSCYNAVGMSAEMMLIQTAWLGAARFLSRGISFERFREAVGSITRQGPGGNFLAEELTLKHLRSGEFFASDLFDFSGYVEAGPSLLERAHERAEELVSEGVEALPAGVGEELEAWMDEAMRARSEEA